MSRINKKKLRNFSGQKKIMQPPGQKKSRKLMGIKYAYMVTAFWFFSFGNFFVKVILWTNLEICSQIWDHNCKIVFPKLEFMFCILSSILSRNMCKLRCNLRKAKIYRLEVQILRIIFFMSFYGQFSHFFLEIWAHIIKSFFF